MDEQQRNAELDRIFENARPEIAAHWESCRRYGLEASTKEATDRVDALVAAFFAALKTLPPDAGDQAILAPMKTLYAGLDEINTSGLLETDERELLVPLFIEAVTAAGIDPAKYHGEPGSEWRDF